MTTATNTSLPILTVAFSITSRPDQPRQEPTSWHRPDSSHVHLWPITLYVVREGGLAANKQTIYRKSDQQPFYSLSIWKRQRQRRRWLLSCQRDPRRLPSRQSSPQQNTSPQLLHHRRPEQCWRRCYRCSQWRCLCHWLWSLPFLGHQD